MESTWRGRSRRVAWAENWRPPKNPGVAPQRENQVPRCLKVAMVTLAAIAVAITSAAAGGALWLHDRLKTTRYCASCHVIAPYYRTWKDSEFTAHEHEKVGITCQDCHSRTTRDGLRDIVLNIAHDNQSPIKEHKVQAKECLRCHGSYEVLASRTKGLIGPDGFALGRNPHDSHWGPLDCGICHKMHKPSEDFCANCHGSPAVGAAWARPR